MDRPAWLREKRRVTEAQDDTIYAPIYDEKWGTIDPTHQQFFTRFLSLCPPTVFIITTPQSRRSKNGSYAHNFT